MGLWKVIGSATGELIVGIIEAVARGEEWEPLIDKFGDELKIKVAQELHRAETIREFDDIRRRILGDNA